MAQRRSSFQTFCPFFLLIFAQIAFCTDVRKMSMTIEKEKSLLRKWSAIIQHDYFKWDWSIRREQHSDEKNRLEFEKDIIDMRVNARFGAAMPHNLSSTFLSVGIDSGEVRRKFKGFDFRSTKLKNLAAALSPSNLRLGGTAADFLIFDPDADTSKIPDLKDEDWDEAYVFDELSYGSLFGGPVQKNFTMTGEQWTDLTNFTQQVGWNMMFDFNLFQGRYTGTWDPTNAHKLLQFSTVRNIPIPVFQLGNEPNSFYHNFNFSIPADLLVKDFLVLKGVLNQYPLYRNSRIVGPDVTSLGRHDSARKYLEEFLKANAFKVISSIGLHQYYLNGRTAQADDFLNPNVLDQMKSELDQAFSINQEYPPMLDVEMTETSSCYGGGAKDLSDRYVAGFLWLDKLGLCAQYGVKRVYRQSFYGGHYALLTKDAGPTPDFFLSVLFKRLVQGPVLNITVSPSRRGVRIYANCARTDFYRYPPGSIVVYYLNLMSSDISLNLHPFSLHDIELYQLTPGDSDGLTSQLVKLNGQTLAMLGPHLPPLPPVKHRGAVTLPAHSFGFVAIPLAREAVCV